MVLWGRQPHHVLAALAWWPPWPWPWASWSGGGGRGRRSHRRSPSSWRWAARPSWSVSSTCSATSSGTSWCGPSSCPRARWWPPVWSTARHVVGVAVPGGGAVEPAVGAGRPCCRRLGGRDCPGGDHARRLTSASDPEVAQLVALVTPAAAAGRGRGRQRLGAGTSATTCSSTSSGSSGSSTCSTATATPQGQQVLAGRGRTRLLRQRDGASQHVTSPPGPRPLAVEGRLPRPGGRHGRDRHRPQREGSRALPG